MSKNKNARTDLWIAEFKNAGMAWTKVNTSFESAEFQVWECVTLPSGKTCLLAEIPEELSDAEFKSKNIDAEKFHRISKWSLEVRDALHSLSKTELGEALLVAECDSVVSIVIVAHELVSSGVALLDMRIGRGTGGRALLYATGSTLELATVSAAVSSSHQEVIVTVVPKVHPRFKEFF